MNSKPVKSDSLSRGWQNTASLQTCAFSLLLNARGQQPGALRAILTAAKEKRLMSSHPSRDKVPPAPRLLAHSSWEVVSSPDFSLSGWECQPENPRRGPPGGGAPRRAGDELPGCPQSLSGSHPPRGPRPEAHAAEPALLPQRPLLFLFWNFLLLLGGQSLRRLCTCL